MQEAIINTLGILLYTSGLLVWPICLFAWRKTGHRTRALRRVFIAEVVTLLVLIGFCAFSRGMLEHQYYWLILMIIANLVFTLLALGAASWDYHAEGLTAPE